MGACLLYFEQLKSKQKNDCVYALGLVLLSASTRHTLQSYDKCELCINKAVEVDVETLKKITIRNIS